MQKQEQRTLPPSVLLDQTPMRRRPGSRHSVQLGFEGIVSKRLGSPYVSGRSRHWIKNKNPQHPAVKREAEEDWGREQRIPRRQKPWRRSKSRTGCGRPLTAAASAFPPSDNAPSAIVQSMTTASADLAEPPCGQPPSASG
jgi:hypothetical protein